MVVRHSIFNELRNDPFLVGFDHLFDRLISSGIGTTQQATSYPPYNIVKNGENDFSIEVALAGYSEDDIQVVVQEDTLTVGCGKLDYDKTDETSYIHRGIAKRSFSRKWTLSPTVVVVGASFVDGLLSISLQNEIPEAKKPRRIHLNNGTAEGPQSLNE